MVGVRGESGAGVDVGVSSGVPGEVGAITNHGNAAGEVVGRNDAGDGVVDCGEISMGRCAGQPKYDNDRPDECFAH